jgi:hypothetical protein
MYSTIQTHMLKELKIKKKMAGFNSSSFSVRFVGINYIRMWLYWPEMIKNWGDSPLRPGAPGPVMSARMLTIANKPLIIPYPKPDTEIEWSSQIEWKHSNLLIS